jgi:transposase-like protein
MRAIWAALKKGCGAEEGVRGRQTQDKALIVAAAEEDGRGIGRIRLRHIPDAWSSRLLPFVKDSVEPGSTVHTDGWLGYLPLEANEYRHRITYLKDHAEQAAELLPRVHRVFSLRKRWCSERIREPSGLSISRITWTSSHSASTGASRAAGANVSIASRNRLWQRNQPLIGKS